MDNKPVRRLRNLRVSEISLVKSPANRKKFIVFKSKDKVRGMPQQDEQTQDTDAKLREAVVSVDEQTMAPIAKAVEGLRPATKAAGNGSEEETSAAAESAGLSPQAQTQLMAIGRIIASNNGGITAQDIMAVCEAAGIDCGGMGGGDDDADAEDPEVELSDDDDVGEDDDDADKAAAAPAAPDSDADDASEDPDAGESGDLDVQMLANKPSGVTESDHADAMDQAKRAYKEHLGKKTPQTDDHDDTAKPFPGNGKKVKPTMKSEKAEAHEAKSEAISMREIQKAQKLLEETNQLLITKNAKLEQDIKDERDHRVLKSMEAECEAEFRNLGVETGKIARILKSRKDAGDTEGHDDLVAILKAANAQVGLTKASGGTMFGPIGKSTTTSNAGSAEARLEAMVDEEFNRVRKSGDKRSRQDVALEVYQTPSGRELYNQGFRERN